MENIHNTKAEQLSEYEQIRLAHIQRNQEFMEKLGLFSIKETLSIDNSKNNRSYKGRIRPPPVPLELRRRSARVKNEKPQYTGDIIDRIGDEMDNTIKKRKLNVENEDDVNYEELMNDAREAAMRHMQEVRLAMLPLAIQDEDTASQDEWRSEAIRRWGAAAGASSQTGRHWKSYVQSRLSTPPPMSPLDFLQEYYAADVWRLLVACILMSRVSSIDTKHRCISAFFSLYPTPTAFLEEEDWSRVRGAINPLGLFDDRLKSLTALTTRFIEADVFDVDPDPKSENKIRGIGDFGYDSYMVFCKDAGPTIKLSKGGKPIAAFVAWRKKIAEAE